MHSALLYSAVTLIAIAAWRGYIGKTDLWTKIAGFGGAALMGASVAIQYIN
jgi:hypothetical protein